MQDEARGGTVGLVAEFLEDKKEFGWREREKKKRACLGLKEAAVRWKQLGGSPIVVR